jgi:hypothetical protein
MLEVLNESKAYHVREFLNPLGLFASSQITVFHGNHPYKEDSSSDLKDNILTQLIISDCHNTIHIHRAGCETIEMYIEKLRLIARVCDEFADHLKSTEL